jgi:cbb3-type cytochrome oxidase subunit 3
MTWFDFAMALRPIFMVWVVLVVVVGLWWYCRPLRRRHLDEHGQIPLNDEQPQP